jgi:signal transduction histidine kinase
VDGLDDRWVRWAAIPAFGFGIPLATGLFGPIGPRDPRFAGGAVAFLALSFAIYHGNRAILLAIRQRWSWFDAPGRKLGVVLGATGAYTAAVTVTALVGWYLLAFGDVDAAVVRTVAGLNVGCVWIVVHGYETAWLVRERLDDAVRVASADRARAEAELAALRAQVDPHFLFNALNTLASLIPADPERALAFNQGLADVYRYILAHRDHDVVPVEEEWAFVQRYLFLLRLRFDDRIRVDGDVGVGGAVPPLALQVLVENAVKHNAFTEREPLAIRVLRDGDALVVENDARPKRGVTPSSGVGLSNLAERARLATGRDLVVEGGTSRFVVRVPVAS